MGFDTINIICIVFSGCITVMKAMASGAIPISSRFEDSVLYNMTYGFDLGPEEPLKITDDYTIWVDSWVKSVINAAKLEKGHLSSLRKNMTQYAKRLYSWEHSAYVFLKKT